MARAVVTDDIKAIRIFLSEWGVWYKLDQNYGVPPHARLRTGGNDIMSTDESIEKTNRAVQHLRNYSYRHFAVIKAAYSDYPSEHLKRILKLLPKELDINSLTALKGILHLSESKISSYRMALCDTRPFAEEYALVKV